jgi:hypothetical protein
MPTAPPTRRRQFQFGIRTTIIVMAIVACWMAWESSFIWKRKNFLTMLERAAEVEAAEGRPTWSAQAAGPVEPATIPFWRSWMGDEAQTVVVLPGDPSQAQFEAAQSLFAEARCFVRKTPVNSNRTSP